MNSENTHILYVEDDEALSFVTMDNLEDAGYNIHHCENGVEALNEFNKHHFDLCILDIMLPKMDGFTLAEKIREKNKHIPILFLSAKSLNEDKIMGFKLGGDDYITKPYSIEELKLKIKVFLKRSKIINDKKIKKNYKLGSYTFKYKELSLIIDEDFRTLTQREADLLLFFAQNSNKILERSEILLEIWGKDDYFLGRSLDVFISRLRKYLNEDVRVELENIHGVGFRLNI